MQKHSKRDWVTAALDQWDREKRAIQRRKRRVAMSSYIAVAAGVVLIALVQFGQFSRPEVLGHPASASIDNSKPIEKSTLEQAQNRVFGIMNGRTLRSRQSMNRLGRGVARLSSRLERKSEVALVNGS